MTSHTVYDFLADPDVLAEHEPLTDDQLAILRDTAVSVDIMMPLSHLIDIVKAATEPGRMTSP